MFKKSLVGAALSMLMLGVAYACTTQTFIGPNGDVVVCTTCCDNIGNCTTTCF
jgi:hypothetical protein